MADGSYYDWGYNQADQLGNGTTTNSDIPVLVHLPGEGDNLPGWECGEERPDLAILKNGSVWAWGNDRFGQTRHRKAGGQLGS